MMGNQELKYILYNCFNIKSSINNNSKVLNILNKLINNNLNDLISKSNIADKINIYLHLNFMKFVY